MAIFGNRAFKEEIKTRLLERVPFQYDWCPCKKRRLWHRSAQRKDQVKIQGKGGCCQLRRETSKKPTLMTPWSGPFKLPAVWENTFCCFDAPQSKVLCLGSLSILRYSLNLLFGAAGGVSCLVYGVLAPGGYSSLAFLLLRVLTGLYLTSPIQSPSSEARE